MFSNLKAAIQKVTSKDTKENEYQGEDIQALIVLLLEACQNDGQTDNVEIDHITNLLINRQVCIHVQFPKKSASAQLII